MNVKNFIVGGIVGGVVDFFLGWLIYGIILNDAADPNAGKENLGIIFAGCLAFGFIISYLFSQGEGITKCVPGIKIAAVVGLLMSVWFDCFYHMYDAALDYKMTAMGAGVSVVIAAIVGATVATVNGKMK